MIKPIQQPRGSDLRLLLIEGSDSGADLTLRRLSAAGFECSFRRAQDEDEMRIALRSAQPDLIIADFTLPRFGGMSALAVARVEAPGVPFIFLAGTIGEERVIEALKCGATDYVLKRHPARLVPAVKRALLDVELRRARALAERQVNRLTGALKMHSGINAALVRIQNRDELMNETCRLAHGVGGYAVAMVALINPATRMARPVGWAGYDFLSQPDQEFPVADHEHGDMSLMGRVIRTGEAVLCDDIKQFPYAIDGREGLIEAGVRSIACMPLRVDNTPVGAFLCGTLTGDTISQDELRLLEEIASNLSFSLQYLDKQDAAHRLSYFEPLTGLAKRALFCERLSRLLSRGSDRLPRLVVTAFDIEHLRVINDSFGRHTGDRLLQCVAERLKEHFPDTEQLAHLGGGTFVTMSALSKHVDDEYRLRHHDVTRVFDRPFNVDGREIAATVKSGLACFPDDGQEPDKLVQNAEAALKQAKTSGEQYLHHRLQMNSELAQRVGMEHRLRNALEREHFLLYYQPKVALRSGNITSAEALLRWQDPDDGLIGPALFLPQLESAGLMPAIGAWVLRQAVADARDWRRMGLQPIRTAINVSPLELRRRNSATEILAAIGDLAGDPDWGIDIEVTEGALAGDSSACVHTLRLLRAAGIRIAIDDFGTGFSSLGRLSELPIDTLKIDRMFTARLPDDRKSCTLVSTIITLAHAFDLTTIAEGVETPEQLKFLAAKGCDESQGYLHSRPLPKADFERLLGLARHSPSSKLSDALI